MRRWENLVDVRGTVPKAAIREWLENWESVKVGDRIPDALPSNSGAKAFDGMTGGKLNKIMLDEAIGKLPRDLQRVVFLRWTGPKVRLRKVLEILGYGKSEYYRRCDLAIDGIYKRVNGLALNYSDLYDSIH